MIRAVLGALWSHWRHNRLQLFTLVAGLALATALWSGVQAINSEARSSYAAAARTLGEGQYDQILRADGRPIAVDTYVQLRRAGWKVSPVIDGRVDGIRVIGVEPLTAPLSLGGVDRDAFQAVGDSPPIFGQKAALDALGRGGVVRPDLAPDTVVTDISVAADLLAQTDPSRLLVLPDQRADLPEMESIDNGLTRRVAQSGSDLSRLTDSFHMNLTAFGFLAFAVGLFIVHGAIGLAFEQRRPMVRTLRALGVPLRHLIVLMAAELLLIAVAAGAVGVVLGYFIAASLLPDVAATLRGLYGADVGNSLNLSPVWWVSGMAVSMGGTMVAAAGALWQISRMPLMAAGRRALAVQGRVQRRIEAIGALCLLALAAGLGVWGQGLIAGFGLLAALLIGGTLALPPMIDLATKIGQKSAGSALSEWFWADTRQQLPSLSLALMALLLAMAANVGVSTMVSSFRLTFQGFLDQRLAAEGYVYADTEEQAKALQPWLTSRTDAVLPIQKVDIAVRGLPTEVYGPIDHETYRSNWTFLTATPTVWDDLHGGGGVVINEQLSRRSGLTLGDVVPVGGRDFVVVGIYGDYGNPIGQAMIDAGDFAVLFPDAVPLRFGIRVADSALPDIFADLQSEFGLPVANMVNQAGIKAFSMGVFDRTFVVTAALNILTLAVAGFAILMSLLTLAGLRVPQLAPVWALGMTRRTLGRLELGRAVLLAVLTALFAVPLGLALAWALLSVVNVEAFGWKLPMFLFPQDYLRLIGQAVIAAMIAAAWPAWKLQRTAPADLLKVFANER